MIGCCYGCDNAHRLRTTDAGVLMTVYRSFVIVCALVNVLAACASGPSQAPEKTIVAPESQISSDSVTIHSDASIEPSAPPIDLGVSEKNALLTLVSKPDDGAERFLRPSLDIDNDIIGALADKLPDGADVSYVVLDVERGIPIAQHQPGQDHIPASSAKLATAVVALEHLGPEHRFRTELRTTGRIEDGVLKGDLILKGGGDPTLDIPDLLPLIDGLARMRIRAIEGRFLIDDTLLPRFSEIEATQPNEAAYNPGVGALSIAFNRVNLQWQNRRGLSVDTVPLLSEASFEAALSDRLPPSGVQLKQFDGNKAVWQLADKGARLSKRSLPVKDPGLYAGRIFADLARLYGLDLPAPERVEADYESRLIAVHTSKPLRELVRDMLWYSNNLVAELIGLSVAKTLTPDLTSLETSAGVLVSELEELMPKVSWDDAWLDNHSGLSSKSRLSPEQLAAILRYGWQGGILSSLLPGSGWSGTLARRFNGPDQALRIWAKTGSINYVSTLGGYLLSPSHSPAAFVIMISDEQARAAYDAQPKRTRASEKKARAWQRGAEEAMDQIIVRWLDPSIAGSSRDLVAMSPANKSDIN